MKIVPVIDLLAGHAVRARQGRRDEYRPLNTPLCPEGDALSLVHRLHIDYPLSTLYLADLDAIEGIGDNHTVLNNIAETYPDLELWVDAGFRTPAAMSELRAQLPCRAVVGSESWQSPTGLNDSDALLSLDADARGTRDPSGIAADTGRWPQDLILMNLENVGAMRGPDLRGLKAYRESAPDKRLYAAGGVRHADDLDRLEEAGASGVLLASALHQGRLSSSDLSRFT